MTLKCTMILGDCLERIPNFEKSQTDLTVCDPPYGVLSSFWDKSIPADQLWRSIKTISKKTAVYCFMASMRYGISLINANKEFFAYDLVWIKKRGTGAFHASSRPMRAHENIFVFNTSDSVYCPQMRKAERHRRGTISKPSYPDSAFGPIKASTYVYGDEVYPLSWIQADPKHARNKLHTSEKPIELISWLVKTYSNEGANVTDPTSGSGTTAIAALSCGRNVTCIEKHKGYFETSVERVHKHIRDNFIRAELEVIR